MAGAEVSPAGQLAQKAKLALVLCVACGGALAQTAGVSAPSAGEERNDLTAGAVHLVAVPVERDQPAAPRPAPSGEPATPRPAASAAPTGQPATGNPLWAIPLDSLHATRERPLFSVSRRPPPAPVAQAEPVAPPPPPTPPAAPEQPQLILVGVVHSNKQNIGVFIDQTGQAVLRLHVGEQQNGWIVRSVDLRATTLEKESQQVKLELPARDADGSTPSGPVVAAIAPAAPPARSVSRRPDNR